REFLRDLVRQLLDATRVVPLPKKVDRRAAHVARVGIGDEALGPVAGPDVALAATGRVGLLGHHQDDDAGVARRIARLAEFAHLPRAADLERDLIRIVLPDVRQRDDHDVAAGLGPDIVDDALDVL